MVKQGAGYLLFIVVPSIVTAIVLNILFDEVRPTSMTLQHFDLTRDHIYFRPSGSEVSGFKGSAVKYHRSPCPALNILANHGYIARDGKTVTPGQLQRVLVQVYNFDNSLAAFLVNELPAQFSLADLSEHNFIEHDASLVHGDSWMGEDPSYVNTTLADCLLLLANDNYQITKMALATFRRDREADSAASTPYFGQTFTFKRGVTTYAETAAMILVIGDFTTGTISVENVRSFLVDERIPDDYEKPKAPVTLFSSLWITLELKVLAFLSPVLI